ncbi:MAG: SLBB domain-containing protein, partial [Bacteroidota bacterium]
RGQVLNPGSFSFVDSLTVEDLILRAGGFTLSAARSYVEVARRKAYDDNSDANTRSKLFNFSISEDLTLSEEASQFLLQPFDLVIVRKSPNYEEQRTVQIRGQVNFPGVYALETKNERISDVLERAGGLSSYAYVEGATLIRKNNSGDARSASRLKRQSIRDLANISGADQNINFQEEQFVGIDLVKVLKDKKSKHDLILQPGDVLSIPKQLETVSLRGNLLYPTTVRYDDKFTFMDYISQSGGYAYRANKNKSFVIYANGTVKRTKRFFPFRIYPSLEPGAEVFVPTKPEKRKISPGEVVGFTTGIATLGLVILRMVDFLEN